MGIFSFGKKDDAPRQRGVEAGSSRRSNQNARVERRSRRSDRSGDAEAMLLDPTLPEKQRARRRLVGAIALVLAAIVILPMVLDSHPKPVTDDIAIDIPSHPADKIAARHDTEDTQAGVAPDNPAPAQAAPGASGLAAAAAAAPQTTQSTGNTPATAASKPAQAATAQTQSTQSTQAAQTPAPAGKPAAQQAATAGTVAASRGKSQESTAAAADSADTSADNADSGAPAAPPGARFAVQLGAFSNDTTARNWVTKLKAVGVPAYTEQRKDADGTTRTLLRAGPFPDRASATAAIAKVRGAGLMAGSNGSAE